MRVTDEEPAPAGPLPWLPGIPEPVATHPEWGAYLAARAHMVTDLAEQVRAIAREMPPDWARSLGDVLTPQLRDEIAVWRAAAGVADHESSVFGPEPSDEAAATYRRRLVRRVDENYGQAVGDWERTVVAHVGAHDPYTADVAQMLERLHRGGDDVHQLLARALARGPLPDDYAAAALIHRIFDELSPQTPPRDTHPSPRTRIAPPPPMSPPRSPNQSPGIGF